MAIAPPANRLTPARPPEILCNIRLLSNLWGLWHTQVRLEGHRTEWKQWTSFELRDISIGTRSYNRLILPHPKPIWEMKTKPIIIPIRSGLPRPKRAPKKTMRKTEAVRAHFLLLLALRQEHQESQSYQWPILVPKSMRRISPNTRPLDFVSNGNVYCKLWHTDSTASCRAELSWEG